MKGYVGASLLSAGLSLYPAADMLSQVYSVPDGKEKDLLVVVSHDSIPKYTPYNTYYSDKYAAPSIMIPRAADYAVEVARRMAAREASEQTGMSFKRAKRKMDRVPFCVQNGDNSFRVFFDDCRYTDKFTGKTPRYSGYLPKCSRYRVQKNVGFKK